jgi:hypothetical protein
MPERVSAQMIEGAIDEKARKMLEIIRSQTGGSE